jgi:hypothetical protein
MTRSTPVDQPGSSRLFPIALTVSLGTAIGVSAGTAIGVSAITALVLAALWRE